MPIIREFIDRGKFMPSVSEMRDSQREGSQDRGLEENRTKLNEAPGHQASVLEDEG